MTLEALKERNNLTLIFRTFSARFKINPGNQGRRVPLRFTLAPGFHIARLWRWYLPLAFLLRAFGAGTCSWLSYCAPLALALPAFCAKPSHPVIL
jgi:hypothetical protein